MVSEPEPFERWLRHEPIERWLRHHGDNELEPGLVDLAVNVRLPSPPSWLAEVIAGSINELGAYPDPREATEAIAHAHDVPADTVLPTAGGAEAFTLIARALPAQRPVIVHPQFTEPQAALRTAGQPCDHVLLDPAQGFAFRPEVVPDEADLIMIGNPTNPTGVLHPAEKLAALRRSDRVVVVDEAFMDAVGDTESLIGSPPEGLLVLRSLTKTWGLAGLRAGYVVGDPRLVALLEAQQPHWSVSTPALRVLAACSTDAALREAAAGVEEVRRWREHLVTGLRLLGLDPVPGAAPFVLVRVGPGVREALRERKYAVRRCDTFPGLDDTWIRIAVRSGPVIDNFLAALGGVL